LAQAQQIRFAGRLLDGTKSILAQFMSMDEPSNRARNRLLLALPARNLKRLMPDLSTFPVPANWS
jgi:hypothetical protein